jgi:IMP cyclohydrolase
MERIRKEAVVAYFRVLNRHFPGRAGEIQENAIKVVGLRGET